jgi:uncharacterized protein YidB (DUF937 family)
VEILNNIAKQFLTDVNADGKVDVADAVSSLQTLLADASGKIDVKDLVSKLQNANLSEVVQSWLDDGKNAVLSNEAIGNLFDSEKLSKFAASLNLELETAKDGLSNAIPNLIDQVSSGGQIVDKFNEGLALLKEEAAEAAVVANATANGLFAKIKQMFS